MTWCLIILRLLLNTMPCEVELFGGRLDLGNHDLSPKYAVVSTL